MNVILLGELSNTDQQTHKHISLAWQLLTPPLPSPITTLAGAASHRACKEQHHSLGRAPQAQSLCWVTGRAQDTHSVAGEALHQAEDGAVEDVGNHTAVTELFLLFPRSLHLGWETRNGPLSLTSPESHKHVRTRNKHFPDVQTPFQGHGEASCEEKTLLLRVVQGRGSQLNQHQPALRKQKLLYWNSCFQPSTC